MPTDGWHLLRHLGRDERRGRVAGREGFFQCLVLVVAGVLLALQVAPWAASPPPSHYRDLIGLGGCIVAENAGGMLLGYGVIDQQGNEIDALFVDPDCGGRGIGSMLMRALQALADPTRPLVLSASLNAVPFYQRAGFKPLRKETYPHPSGVALASVRMQRG